MRADPALYQDLLGIVEKGGKWVLTNAHIDANSRALEKENRSKNQLELVERAGRLHDKVVLFLDSFTTVGFELGQATDAYEKAVEQLSRGSGNVIRQTEMLKELGAKTKKGAQREERAEESR